jgi:hypothetical protein
MWSPKIERSAGMLLAAVLLAGAVAGCSDLYLDRRDSIALSAGDAIEANKVAQVIDPWPPYSGNTNLTFNGQRMQSAVERYRTDQVTPPVDPMMLQVANPSSTTAQTNSSQSTTSAGTNSSGQSNGSTTTSTTTTTGQ